MADELLPLPPFGTPVYQQDGQLTEPWRRYFQSLENFTGSQIPPIGASYWVSTGNPALTNETNLGALASGYLKIATAIGVASPYTIEHIPGLDIVNGSIPNVKLANMAAATIKGRALGAGTGSPQDLTGAQVAAIVGAVVGSATIVDSLLLMGG